MDKKTLLFASIIFILGLFLRLYNIGSVPPGLYPDEAMNGNNALEAIRTGEYKTYYPENNGREGLFINIQALFLKAFGNQPWALRSVAALFGAGTVVGIFFLAYELFVKETAERRRLIALSATFFAATGVWAIILSRIGFRANMAPFFLTWSIFLFLFALRKIKSSPYSLSCVLSLISSGLLFGLGFHSYIAFRIAPLIALVLIIAAIVRPAGSDYQQMSDRTFVDKKERKRALAASAVFILCAVISFAPLGFYYLSHPQDFFGRTAQISVFGSESPTRDLAFNVVKTLGMFNFVGDWNWRHNYAGSPQLFWPVGILFVLGIAISAVRLWKYRSDRLKILARPETILFAWFLVMMLPVVISNEGIPHALRAIILIPPVFILCGIGASFILEKIRIRFLNFLYAVTISVFVMLFTYQAYYRYFIQWGQSANVFNAYAGSYADIAQELLSAPQNLDKYVVVNANGVDVRGVPMPAQTVMFITDTFLPKQQLEKKIFYVTDRKDIPQDKKMKMVVPLELE